MDRQFLLRLDIRCYQEANLTNPKETTYFEEHRLLAAGDPVVWTQNGEQGRVLETKDHGNQARVKFESGYEAWFPTNVLRPNRSVS